MKPLVIARLVSRTVCVAAAVLAFVPAEASAQLSTGDIVVYDRGFDSDAYFGRGAVLRIDGITGARTVLSDLGNGAQGPIARGDCGMALEGAGTIVVGHRSLLLRVDPATGTRGVLSDFTDPAQGALGKGGAVAVEHSGGILVMGFALVRVHPVTGMRTTISDFTDPAQGPLGSDSQNGIAVESSGTILVVDEFGPGGAGGVVFRVNPSTGMRTVVTDFANPAQGPVAVSPREVAVESAGTILITTSDRLFRVDPANGTRVVVSDFSDPGQGAVGQPISVAVESAGTILVGDAVGADPRHGLLFRVDPTSGMRTVLSDFGNASQGQLSVFSYYDYDYYEAHPDVGVPLIEVYEPPEGPLPPPTFPGENRPSRVAVFAPFTNLNTPPGTDIVVNASPAVSALFSSVTGEGDTTATVMTTEPTPPGGFAVASSYYDISTTASYSGTILVCISYDPTGLTPEEESALRLLHYENGAWADVTTMLDTGADTICGEVSSLSPFVIGTPRYAPAGTMCLGEPGHVILPPIRADGTSVFRRGATVPAKFRVSGLDGTSIGRRGVVSSFTLVQIMAGTVVTEVNQEVPSTTPDSSFRWDSSGQQWVFNINTSGLAANATYRYRIGLNDGTAIDFQFGLK